MGKSFIVFGGAILAIIANIVVFLFLPYLTRISTRQNISERIIKASRVNVIKPRKILKQKMRTKKEIKHKKIIPPKPKIKKIKLYRTPPKVKPKKLVSRSMKFLLDAKLQWAPEIKGEPVIYVPVQKEPVLEGKVQHINFDQIFNETNVDEKPKPGSLQLNVSLRDFKVDIYDYTKAIIVDDWEEVCREKTDIEMMHIEKGLNEEDTKTIADVVCNNALAAYPEDEAIMFNPMGMAVFDISTSRYYMDKAKQMGVGKDLE